MVLVIYLCLFVIRLRKQVYILGETTANKLKSQLIQFFSIMVSQTQPREVGVICDRMIRILQIYKCLFCTEIEDVADFAFRLSEGSQEEENFAVNY